jgi:hypothetical protein
LFWKSKKTEPELIDIETDDKRSSFRVCPHKKFPVHSSVDGCEVRIIDLGAGGMGFRNIHFREGDRYTASIKLSEYDREISVDLYIISIDPNDICHCCFKKIKEDDVDAIHRYMLEVQKEELKEKKAAENKISRSSSIPCSTLPKRIE